MAHKKGTTISVEEALKSNTRFFLYSVAYEKYVFPSKDKVPYFTGDSVVEAHGEGKRDDPRNLFVLQRADGKEGLVRIHCPELNTNLYVSDQKSLGDNVVAARPVDGTLSEAERYNFMFEELGEKRYRIYSPIADKYLFASRDHRNKNDLDNVIEAHGQDKKDDERNEFVLLLP